MSTVLLAAAAYNLAWAVFLIVAPNAMFDWLGMARPNYPSFTQGLGMMIGLMGVGYAIASTAPLKYWPLVALGFLAKVASPFGFLKGWLSGELPGHFGWQLIPNDIIWWAPFGIILWTAYQSHVDQRATLSPEVTRMALRMKTSAGVPLQELTRLSPVLLVFLRHFGCTFCREAMDDLARQRRQIEAEGTRLVLVHMGTEEQGRAFCARYDMQDVQRIADPGAALYRAFGLVRGRFWQLFSPEVLFRGAKVAFVDGKGVGLPVEDGFQMPGVFLLFHGEVLKSFRHRKASDRPNYLEMVSLDNVPTPVRK